jgi:hypothetical protein
MDQILHVYLIVGVLCSESMDQKEEDHKHGKDREHVDAQVTRLHVQKHIELIEKNVKNEKSDSMLMLVHQIGECTEIITTENRGPLRMIRPTNFLVYG